MTTFYSQLLEEQAFLLEKKTNVHRIITSIVERLKSQSEQFDIPRTPFIALAKNILQDFSALENAHTVEKSDSARFNHVLEKLNTWIAALQLIGRPKNDGALHLNFLTRLTAEFITTNASTLAAIKLLCLNGENATHHLILDNKIFFLPENIDTLKSLETLVLDHNKLIKLPNSIGNLLQLKMLSVEGNKIPVLPNTLSRLKNLKIVGVHETLVTLPSINEIPTDNLIGLSKTLTHLYDKSKKVVKEFLNKPLPPEPQERKDPKNKI